jgi:predicted nucleotidyltransferase component of viral defense system
VSRKSKAEKILNELRKLSSSGSTDLSFNELKVIIAIERIVARLQASKLLSKHLIYKGGFVLLKTYGSNRFTRDLDALGMGLAKEEITEHVPVALDNDIDDGFWFGDVKIQQLIDQGEYGGLRFNLAFHLGDPPKSIKKLSRVHFDIGFGDKVEKIVTDELKSIILIEKNLSWRVYPAEFIFSEKLQTFIIRAELNSRAKDIYDMVNLFSFGLKEVDLSKAIKITFEKRETNIPDTFYGFAENLDLEYLKNAWATVTAMKGNVIFKDYWNNFLNLLKKIDSYAIK